LNPTSFAYHRAGDIQEAIALLEEHGESAKLLAGGHSLLPILKLRLAEPDRLIDISRIDELHGISEFDGGLRIGALTTHADVASDSLVLAHAPVLAAAASRIGDRQVRNRGTIGGALAHADAASDYPAPILALEATIVARGPSGERRIPAREFFVDFLTTALKPNELLTAVELPSDSATFGWSYQKLANQASGYAIVGVAALVSLDERSRVSDVRVGVTGAAAVPWRAVATEAALRGSVVDDQTALGAAALGDDGIDLLDDLHGSAEYRRHVTRGLTRRAILEAAGRAAR
jgi:carbon-monoxide dehydrogenase medium subunit